MSPRNEPYRLPAEYGDPASIFPPETAPTPRSDGASTRGGAQRPAVASQEQPEPPPAGEGARSTWPRLTAIFLDDICLEDDPAYLVHGLLPAGPCFGVVFGPPKSLKSFLLMDVFLHIPTGRAYAGRKVQAGAVVYVTSEGVPGVKRRLIAMRRWHGVEGARAPFILIPAMPNLGTGTDDLNKLIELIKTKTAGLAVPVRAIAIDTLRRAIPGKDENAQKDMSIFVANCETLAREFDCTIVAVHHSPRADNTRGSGSNAVDGAADFMWSVTRADNGSPRAVVAIDRMKDGQEGDNWSFELRMVEVGLDKNGRGLVTCYVEITSEPGDTSARPATSQPVRLKAQERRLFDILERAVAESGATVASDLVPRNVRAVTRDELKRYCTQGGYWTSDKPDAQRAQLSKYLNNLAAAQVVGTTAEHAWIARRLS